jgi:peptide deformylase
MKLGGSGNMGALSIVTINPSLLSLKHIVLRQRADEVPIHDAKFLEMCRTLAPEMFEVMYAHDGAALAAPQVGIPLRLVVMDPQSLDFGPHVLINPVILYKSETEEPGNEGCLSIPLYIGKVYRSTEVHVRAYDLRGEIKEYKVTGWLARIFQHEIDHLEGILYPDRLKPGDNLVMAGTVAHRRALSAMKKLEE